MNNIYYKNKIQKQRILITFLAGGLLAAAFALCVGCGEQRATEPTEAEVESWGLGAVVPQKATDVLKGCL